MHFKKELYIKGIHIKLLYKNNLLRCTIYNYGHNEFYLYHLKDQILISNKTPIKNKEQMIKHKITRHPLLLSQKISVQEITSKLHYFNFHLTDEKNEDIFIHNPKFPFIANTPISFSKTSRLQLDNEEKHIF